MISTHNILRERLLARAGLIDRPPCPVSVDALERSEWSPRFERLMRNRLIMGAMRYGRLHAVSKPAYDRLQGLRKRLEQYQQSGNLECLVDVANMALLEFEEGTHPNRHWSDITEDHTCQ
jgi:hypothetical protein